ncbi:MAG: hypothetical protein OEY80_14080, partial [Nitrospirota bacterium]|nr:hypothetical protein [Nitrospirota bacterium]
ERCGIILTVIALHKQEGLMQHITTIGLADAEAIAEALVRPTMRFLPLKSADQQEADSIKASGHGAAHTDRIHDGKPQSVCSTNQPCIFGSVHT